MYSIITYKKTNYGKISCHLKKVMKEKKVSTYWLSQETNIKYEIIKRYRDNEMQRYDADILAKICFCLDCDVGSVLKYEK